MKRSGSNKSGLSFTWRAKEWDRFTTGVSLHGHTMHSRESLDFIERVTGNVPWLSSKVRKEKAIYRKANGRDMDLRNAWWTPPLSARQAWDLEKRQIESTLERDALVSLSDHDNIDACLNLNVLEETRNSPISIEWTVPFRLTFFHIGVHNLPPDTAVAMTAKMHAFTANPDESELAGLLEYLGASRETLLILNHPMWDESHIGEEGHLEHLQQLLEGYAPLLHALELNGLRPWSENMKAVEMAERFHMPVVSGGDRHGREPNACVNLTAARTFAEFVSEIRDDGESQVVFLPHYRESLKMRVVENVIDILKDDPNHALGWRHWSSRVFYRDENSEVRSLHELWGGQMPSLVARFEAVKKFAENSRVRSALRLALIAREQFAL